RSSAIGRLTRSGGGPRSCNPLRTSMRWETRVTCLRSRRSRSNYKKLTYQCQSPLDSPRGAPGSIRGKNHANCGPPRNSLGRAKGAKSIGTVHLEQVRPSTIVISSEPSDRLQPSRIHTTILVQHALVDVDQKDLADDQVACQWPVPERHDLAHAAFEMNRRLRD